MGLMSGGPRRAAGPALRHLLCAATHARAQALGSGILVTALVQSSGTVTVATIGFVNAGLLALGPALWVLFGANVGTTMTGWIVATIGLKFQIEAPAMPLIGLGALLRLSGQGQRASAFGTALAGFGLLFLGIALLQQTFGSLSAHLTLPQGEGASAVLARVGIGVLMTVLMQSSSAAMAITLMTAAQGSLIDAQGAAAVVIGANIGTTATALMTRTRRNAQCSPCGLGTCGLQPDHRRGGATAAAEPDRRRRTDGQADGPAARCGNPARAVPHAVQPAGRAADVAAGRTDDPRPDAALAQPRGGRGRTGLPGQLGADRAGARAGSPGARDRPR